MNVGDFIYPSKALADVKGQYLMPEDFLEFYSKLDDIERKSLVFHYIMDNSPYAFNEVYKKPLLYEQVKQYIAHVLDLDISHIKLIGSTKTGFKMDIKDYGVPYTKDRDLDFMIIDEYLFNGLKGEFEVWKEAYLEKNEMQPRNDKEKSYWEENIYRTLPNAINFGFIDTKHMPNNTNYLPLNSKVNNTVFLVYSRLKSAHGFCSIGASVRVYKDVDCYYCQQCRNINAIIDSRNK